VLFDGKYHLWLLWSYGGHRSLNGRRQNLSLGVKLWPWSPWEPGTMYLPTISLADEAGSQRRHHLGVLALKIALLSTLKTYPWIWTGP
jgi:hypothetical protein